MTGDIKILDAEIVTEGKKKFLKVIAGDAETKVQVVIPKISLDSAKVGVVKDNGQISGTISFSILAAYE